MARIRTIKPEFWRHPVMARQPDDVRLMAIALLNIADDEGYFYADPALLRGEIWPFDDNSSRTRRTLEHLSRIGWITLSEHSEIGMVGHVTNFTKHQKVDRPNPSKIKAYGESPNARRIVVEQSSPEQGTGNREQGTGNLKSSAGKSARFDPLAIDLPDSIDMQAWQEWIAYRRSRKLTNTEQTIRGQIAKLLELHREGHNPAEVIRESIASGWQGLFPSRQRGPGARSIEDRNHDATAGWVPPEMRI